MLARLKIPVITFNTPVRNEWVVPVSCDNVGAARSIAELFVARGARSFGFISGPKASFASVGRLEGFSTRLRELDAGPLTIASGDYHYEGGFAAACELYGGASKPEALFCANDLLALGAMDALRNKLGLRIPQDVLVAGFDDIAPAAWAAYDLTTFVHDAERMVDEALAIVAKVEAGSRPGEHDAVIVPAPFIERGSTRQP